MPRITGRGELVRKYCKRHPAMPALTLARLIHSEHGHLWEQAKDTAVLNIRTAIRYHRGNMKNGSGRVTDDPIASTAGSSTVAMPYRAPMTWAEDRTDFVIHGAQRILRLSDIHFPIHDAEALNAAMDYGRQHDPTIILLDGDIADLHDFSFHAKGDLRSFVQAEADMIAEFMEALRVAFPKARIIWKEGNHEVRFIRYLTAKAPELAVALEDRLDLPGFICLLTGNPNAMNRVEWVSGQRIIKAGRLSFLHGHEFRGGGGVNPARWLFLRTGENAICGHFHRTSEHSEPSLSGEQRGAWSTGCLCHLSPDYLRHNKWNHGFAWVDVTKDGAFRVKNIRILDGAIY